MKKNYIKYTTVFLLGMGVFASCKKSFLQVNPKGEFAASNYYQTPDQAFAGLAAAYDPLTTETGGLDGTYTDVLGPLNSASDDCYAGGGGPNDTNDWQLWNNYQLNSAAGPQQGFWPINFLGVSRANTILAEVGGVPGLSDDLKKRYTAEAQFLRAHYYFDLERLFKNVPLILKPLAQADIYNQLQAKPADVYAQIEADLTAAIPNLPATVVASEQGRVTQGAAIALLGKVYLYEKKWAQAATEFAIVNGTPGGTTPVYGYHLVANFGSIFSPNNKFNSEAIFEITRTATQAYTWNNWNTFKGNVYVQMVGPRNFGDATYAGGWGFNPVTKLLHDALKGDPRYGYTVLDMDSLVAVEKSSYQASYQNTGYFLLKYAPLTKYKATQGQVELNYPNDYIEIRLADTYLMEAEALVMGSGGSARAQALLDAVRARVGLASVPVSMTTIKNERRLELATEGHRWFDLVRWGDAPTVLSFKGFQAGKNELLPIPLTDLSATKLVQNPGYAN
ncbi:Starch-binding associating with outer membrane [Mucilaginibacter mallensis]|uniref:Starch-binding associating with outer membrane n=1 Tax=Mucilaginibacter mallensis TaxID=652787 RepID=A0A1H1TIG6_MUCMA|nr:RagB/SusD family nutrient uptake outer membrane protein [Mucilaginibacter mallensis]SDS59994.1 Starch-binding associating with outer membrane [Mucilaginibacter mallensis]